MRTGGDALKTISATTGNISARRAIEGRGNRIRDAPTKESSDNDIGGGGFKRTYVGGGAVGPCPATLICGRCGGIVSVIQSGTARQQWHGGSRSAIICERAKFRIGVAKAPRTSQSGAGIRGDVVAQISDHS